jgi:hypothetical protein
VCFKFYACANFSYENTCKGTLKEHPITSLKADLRGSLNRSVCYPKTTARTDLEP